MFFFIFDAKFEIFEAKFWIFKFLIFFENPVKLLKNNPPTPPKAFRINPKIFDFLTPEAEGRPFLKNN